MLLSIHLEFHVADPGSLKSAWSLFSSLSPKMLILIFFIIILNIAHGQTARIIDGKTIAEEIRLSITNEVRQMKDSIGNVPGLGVILVGQRRDSCIYVRNKIIACEEVGIKFLLRELPDNCSDDDISYQLKSFNENPCIHGILVQLPLPQVNSLLFFTL